MIDLRVFKPEYLDHINHWMGLRGRKLVELSDLPAYGLVAFNGARVVAAGFLRKIEGNMALIDGLCADPSADHDIKDQCLDAVIMQLVKRANRENIFHVLGHIVNTRTLERSKRLGFQVQPYTAVSYTGEFGK